MRKDKDCIDFNDSATVGDCASVEVDPITTPGGDHRTVTMRVPVTLAESVYCKIEMAQIAK
ncbi:hypothetical protein C0966_05240 [Bacillus methanolicus]|uniref:hypothetical protein n=1 Tax=Bacillus methanolicus TaxID=1471 RepID=UPI0023806C11|nr:hypothetical protein [Bacillus methanolicus]MDE3838784.1 hypothetical protein [Bacillus methanolicus]